MKEHILNPFSFWGNPVCGDKFIGRQKEIQTLEARIIAGTFTQVVGLPRMGKSSLSLHCFDFHALDWVNKYKLIPIRIVAGAYNTPWALWKNLAEAVKLKLEELELDCIFSHRQLGYLRQLDSVYSDLSRTKSFALFHLRFCSYLRYIKKLIGYKFIIALDELDDIARKFKSDSFMKMRELSECSVVVTFSKRTIQQLEYAITKKRYLSNLCEEPIFIGVFSSEDVDLYWEKFGPELSLPDHQLEEYKHLVSDYVGSHPYLMTLMNSFSYEGKISSLFDSHSARKKELELELRVKLKDHLMTKQLNILEDQGLKDTAIQLLIGEDPQKAEDALILTKYTFLQYGPCSIKDSLFPSEVGPKFENGTKSYRCFSDFATHLFYEEFTKDLDYSDLLKQTELHLRVLVQCYLHSQNGPNPFHIIEDFYFNCPSWGHPGPKYKEQWEDIMRSKVPASNIADWEETLKAAKKARLAQLKFELASTQGNRNLVDFLTIGQLWYLFLDIDWSWFQNILGNASKSDWHDNNFEEVRMLRNSKDHYQINYLQQVKIDNVKCICLDITNQIDSYFKSVGLI